MAVDKGGLRYPIEVIDLFSRDFERFRRQVREARRSMGAFRAEAAAFSAESQSISRASREIGRSSKQIAAGQRELEKSAQTSKKAAQDTVAATEKQTRASKKASAATKSVADEEKAQLKRLRDEDVWQKAKLRQKRDLAKAEKDYRNELQRTATLRRRIQSGKIDDPTQTSPAALERQLNELDQKARKLDNLNEKVNGRTAQRPSEQIATQFNREQRDADLFAENAKRNAELTKRYDQQRLERAKQFSEGLRERLQREQRERDQAHKTTEKKAQKSLDRQRRQVEKAQTQFDRLSEKAARGQKLTNKEFFDRLRAQEVVRTGQPVSDDFARKAAAAERRSAAFQSEKNAKAVKATTTQTQKATTATKSLKGELQKIGGVWGRIGKRIGETESSANRMAFTFRRLIGILAAFTIARQAVQGFQRLVVGAVQFNSKLEQSRLGIASLITAVGDVADITGQSADAATQLELAQKEARRQTELLRKEAIQTAATFDQLVETFQVGLAPGLTAGLDIDQIRKLTVQISQAATAIGLPQNQLAEEIRSLLAGTIQARTTRIATSLGITNEDVRLMKEAGTLAEFLQSRFAAFEKAGRKASQTFAALFTNTQAAFQQVIDTGFVDFFKELRGLLNEVQGGLVDLSGAEVEVNPKAVQAARALGDGLAAAVQQARVLVQNLSGGDIVAFASAVGRGVAILAKGVRAVVEGVIEGVAVLVGAGRLFVEQTRSVVNEIAKALGFDLEVENSVQMLKTLIAIATVVGTISAGFHLAAGAAKGLAIPLVQVGVLLGKALSGVYALVKGFATLNLATLPLTLKLVAVVAIVALIAEGIRQGLNALTGTNLKAETLFKILFNKVVKAIKSMVLLFKAAGGGVAALGADIVRLVLYPIQKALEGLAAISGGLVGDDSAKGLEKFRKELEKTSNAAIKAGREAFFESQRLAKEVFTVDDADTKRFVAENEKARTLLELLGDGIKSVGGAISESLGGVSESLKGANQEIVSPVAESRARTLEEVYQKFPGYISTAAAGMKDVEESSQRVKDSLRDAQTELEVARGVGFRTDANPAIVASLKLRKKLQQDIRGLEKQSDSLGKRREALLKNANRLLRETEALSENDRRNAFAAFEALKERLQIKSKISELEGTQDRVRISLGQAATEGDTARVAALRNELLQLKNTLQGLRAADANYETFLAGLQNLFPEEIRVEMVRLIDDLLKNEQTLNGVTKDRLKFLGAIQKLTENTAKVDAARRTLAARQQSRELQNENRILEVRAENARRLSAALLTDDDADDRAAELKNALEIARAEAQIERERVLTKRQQLALDIQSGRYQGESLEAQQDLLGQLDQQALLLERIASAEEVRQNKALAAAEREAALRRQGDVAPGLQFGLGNFADQFQSYFDAFANIAEQSMALISSTISGALLDAFDPTDESKTIQERFRDLTRGILKIILDELARAAIARLIGSLLTGGAGAATGSGFFNTGAFGLQAGAKGGEIRGYATGGPVTRTTRPSIPRPRGLDPRDTVPIYAQEGEWMMRLSAVKRYGLQAMHAINEGLVDPSALQALAGSFSTRRTTRKARKIGYVEGGRIAAPGPVSGGASRVESPATEPQGPQQAVVLFGPEEFERMLAANKSGMVRFMRENKRAAGIQK